MSLWSTLAQIGGIAAAPFTGGASLAIPAALEVGSKALGAAANSSASNRSAQVQADIEQERLRQQSQRDFWQALVAREQEGRASGTDALKKLQQTSYLENRTGYRPTTLSTSVGSKTLPSFGFGPAASTEADVTGAQALRNEVMKRLQGGNAIPEVPNPYENPFMLPERHAGFWEKFAGIASPILGTASALYGSDKDKKSK
jgi:hypothetical protein